MAKPTPKKRVSKAPYKPRGRKARPKSQQATSVNAIIRERVKGLAIQYRIAGFSVRTIADAINQHYGAGGEGATETPEIAAAFWKVHRKGVSYHHVHDLIREAIRESVDPLSKEELRDLTTQQMQAVMAAMIGPAMQGSVPHTQTWQSLLRDFAKLVGLVEDKDDKNAGAITQIFVNGALAAV